MIGNLAIKNTGDKSKSEIGKAWEKFESDKDFINLGITKSNKQSIDKRKCKWFRVSHYLGWHPCVFNHV